MKTQRLLWIHLTALCSVWNISVGETNLRLLTESEATEIVTARESAKTANYQAQIQELGIAKIIDRKVVQSGNDSLTINTVKPMVLPKPAEEVSIQASSEMTTALFQTMLTEQQTKLSEQISMAATVYDGEYSEIIWRDTETRSEYTVWTNISLDYLRPVSSLHDEAYDYTYFGFVTSYTREDEAVRINLAKEQGFHEVQSRWKTPPVAFSPDQWEYVVIADYPAEVPQKLYRQMNAVLGHYVANQADLEMIHLNTLMLQKAKQEYLKANPPAPRPTMLNFWKIDNEAAAN